MLQNDTEKVNARTAGSEQELDSQSAGDRKAFDNPRMRSISFTGNLGSWYVGIVTLLVVLIPTHSLLAQSADVAEEGASTTYSMQAFRVDDTISLDGRLDEAVWESAEPVSGFVQTDPVDGAVASFDTEVRVLYGANNIYVGAIMYDDDPGQIEAALGRRDDYNRADWFLVSIDSYNDKRTAYIFGLNAAGIQLDAIRTSARGGMMMGGGGGGFGRSGGSRAPRGSDATWDAIWFSSHRITSEGWIAEIRIPYSMLRFPEAESMTWGVQFTRRIPRLGEDSEWPHVPRTERANLVAQFGDLNGIENVKPKRNIQVIPYSVSRHMREPLDENDTIERSNSFDIGSDFKIGLGTNVTLDATVNPDFGQVESDPAVLNLTAFETYYSEKRPFFLEGMQIFQFDIGRGSIPYTRRIGSKGPIIGAAKLSGRTAGGTSFGLLSASTGDNFNPSRNYEIARLSQQIGMYSSMGIMSTFYDGPVDEETGRDRSLFTGIDYDLRFGKNVYNFAGFVGFIRNWETQPDGGGDTGFGMKALFSKRLGTVTGWFGIEGYDDFFRLNDVGQLRQINYFTIPFRLQYEINNGQPFGPFLRASVSEYAGQMFSVDDRLNMGQYHWLSARGTLKGYRDFGLSARFSNPFGGYDIYETRGNGAWKEPKSAAVSASVETDARRDWRVEPDVEVTFDSEGGRMYELSLRGSINLGSRFALSGNVSGEIEDGVQAWSSNETFVRAEDDSWLIGLESSEPDAVAPDAFTPLQNAEGLSSILAQAEEYDTDRYYIPVFGNRDTKSLDITLRNTTTFTKNLSLQIYSQILLARGRYQDFQILRDMDNLSPFDAYPKRDEFSLTSLTSNVVLRWEYRPGSSLYLVWTHARNGDDELNPLRPWGVSPWDHSLNDQFHSTFDLASTNVFLMKVNYTFLY